MPDSAQTTGELAAAISNAIVRISAAHHGRGPSKAKTFILDDVVVTMMQDSAAPIERTLANAGEEALARSVHDRVQDAIGGELKAAVQELTGRRVIALMSASHLEPDVSCAVFVLAPPGAADG